MLGKISTLNECVLYLLYFILFHVVNTQGNEI